MSARIIKVYFNVGRSALADADNNPSANTGTGLVPFMYYKEQPIMNIQFTATDGTGYDMSSFASFSAAADNSYDHEDFPILVDDSKFNQASSWWDADNEVFRDPVPSDGEITIQLNATNTEFYDFVGTDKSKTATFEVQADDSLTNLAAVFTFQFECRNTIDTNSYIPIPVEPEFVVEGGSVKLIVTENGLEVWTKLLGAADYDMNCRI